MPIDTHVDHARTRTEAEREALDAKLDAIEDFLDRLETVPTTDGTAPDASPVGAGATQVLSGRASTDGCRAVRRAFAETIRPHSVEDVDEPEPLQATLRSELSKGVAAALSPETDAPFTPLLRRTIRAEAETRRLETVATIRALRQEAASLDAATDVVDDITDWLVAADEQPLSALGFEALRERHERLATERSRLDDLVVERQAPLDGATSLGGDIAVGHRSLLTYLYQDFPVDHPVLATAVGLDEACETAQRAVRDHLVRQV